MQESIIREDLDIAYNLDYLVIVPVKDKNLYEDFVYTFKNVILFHNTVEDIERVVGFRRNHLPERS